MLSTIDAKIPKDGRKKKESSTKIWEHNIVGLLRSGPRMPLDVGEEKVLSPEFYSQFMKNGNYVNEGWGRMKTSQTCKGSKNWPPAHLLGMLSRMHGKQRSGHGI